MDKMVPHMLGLDLVEQIVYFTNEALESFEEDFTWLDEILETAKTAFQTSQIQTLPKTPSAKRRKGRKRKSDVPSFIRRSSIFPKGVDQSLNDSYNAENIPPPRLNTSSTYGTRATRALRSRQKADTSADLSIGNTSALRTRNTRNNSARNTFTQEELSPPKEVPESPVKKKQRGKPPKVEQPEEAPQPKPDLIEETVTKIAAEEQSSPVADKNASPIEVEASPLPAEPSSPEKPVESPEVSVTNNTESESRVTVNNSSYVIETPSEEDTALTLPVISSPVEVPASNKPEAMDTDSGVNSDDKEQEVPPAETGEHSDGKASSDADTERDTGKPSSNSALSSEETSEPLRTRTRTRKQQQSVPAAALLPVPCRESISSTTSAELNEAPTRMTRSRMRTKPPATTEPALVPVPVPAPVAVNPPKESCDSAMSEDKPEEEEEAPRTRTRTRLQKRLSCEMEDKTDSDMKRQCTETKPTTTEKRRSSRLSSKNSAVPDSPEDADAEDSDPEDANASTTESWMASSNYRTPNNLSTARSFLSTMNNSYMSANRTPSQKSFTLYKYVNQNSSMTGSSQRAGTQSRLNLLSGIGGNIKSLLKKSATPSKGTPKITQGYLDQRKKELEEKRKKEEERLMKREELQKMKMEERKKKREERMRKVAESRQLQEIQEKELKDKKTKKLEEKLSVTDRIREEKLREEREKLRLRYKKQQEAEDRRNQEDEERTRKLREQEEENQRHQVMLQRKKEFEEHERQRKAAEEKRKIEEQKERMLEVEKEKQIELERRLKIEEERERERQKLKEEREKEAARLRLEKLELIKEKQKEAEEIQRQKLRELEQERLLYEQQMADKKQQREQYIAKVLNQPSNVISPAVAPLSLSSSYQKEVSRPVGLNTTLNTSQKTTSNSDSYQMTPVRSSYNNYDITGLKSDDSTDEEEGPRKPIPGWAKGPELKISLLKQYYNPPNLDQIFVPIVLPDLNELFVKKKSRFNRRTSSAMWDSPILKSHIPVYN